MNIVVFALVVMFAGEQEQIASYWINQKHCLHDARMLSSRAEAYQPIKAYCKPVIVDLEKITVRGYPKNGDR
mgnify:FL=1